MSRDIIATLEPTNRVDDAAVAKERVIVLAVTVQGLSKTEAARRYGVSRRWVHTLVTRYEAGGLDALEPRSRRPRTTPGATVRAILELRVPLTTQGLDGGSVTIAWHPARRPVTVSRRPPPSTAS